METFRTHQRMLRLVLFLLCSFISLGFGTTLFAMTAERVTVKKFIDGDTIDVIRMNGVVERIRFAGIDTPESKNSKKLQQEAQKCKTSEQQMITLGKYSSKQLQLLYSGLANEPTTIKSEPTKGKYGRTIATVYFGKANSNAWLVLYGFACAYRNNTAYQKYEARARSAKAGFWKTNPNIMQCLCQ